MVDDIRPRWHCWAQPFVHVAAVIIIVVIALAAAVVLWKVNQAAHHAQYGAR
jgi:hypothetical protein